MKRYHEELALLKTRAKKHRLLEIVFDTLPPNSPDIGRFRKALRCGGCGKARCQLCHPEKYPRRIPTRQEIQAKRDLRDAVMMIPSTSWRPSDADIAWQKSWLRILKDNGTWCVPMNRSVFQVNNTEKTFVLIEGDATDETNRRIAVVFKVLGYEEKERKLTKHDSPEEDNT